MMKDSSSMASSFFCVLFFFVSFFLVLIINHNVRQRRSREGKKRSNFTSGQCQEKKFSSVERSLLLTSYSVFFLLQGSLCHREKRIERRTKRRRRRKKGEISSAYCFYCLFFICAYSKHANARSLDRRMKGTAKNRNNIKKEILNIKA